MPTALFGATEEKHSECKLSGEVLLRHTAARNAFVLALVRFSIWPPAGVKGMFVETAPVRGGGRGGGGG